MLVPLLPDDDEAADDVAVTGSVPSWAGTAAASVGALVETPCASDGDAADEAAGVAGYEGTATGCGVDDGRRCARCER